MFGRQERKRRKSKWLQFLIRFLFLTYIATTIISFSGILHPSVKPDSSTLQYSELSSLSSVDYYACCGLGHRLIRMSLAHYVARLQGFALRSFWGWCGERSPIEVFSYLFEPPPINEVLLHAKSRNNLVLPFYNEVPGFVAVSRNPNHTCPCHVDKIETDLELYSSLRNRFRGRNLVDAFVQEHFQHNTVIGIHVRAGNGEEGDFNRKGRNIENPRIWVQQVSQLLQDFWQEQSTNLPPLLLYIATDTPSMVTLFREELQPFNIPVLDVPMQGRREEGQGVLFGVSDQVFNKDRNNENDYSTCLNGWTDTLMDMFLLSHADVVVAAKPSSFSQTAPMSLVFGNQQRNKKLSKVYCEVLPPSAASNTTQLRLQCYDTYLDWCCNYSTWIQFRHQGPNGKERVHAKEFVKFVPMEHLATFAGKHYPAMRNRSEDCPRPRRGRAGGGLKDKCLPHHW